MTDNEILIHDRNDLRPGDVLRVWPQGIPEQWAEGPICETTDGWLMVCGLLIRRSDGEWVFARFDLTAHPARREVPDLPTERGSVVRVTQINISRLPWPSIGVLVENGPEAWSVLGWGYRRADEITGWVPLTVTEAGPEVTR